MSAVKELYADHMNAVGASGSAPLIEGSSAAQASGGFTSQAEIVKARRDRRYETDPAYRERSMRRLAKTPNHLLAIGRS